MLQRAGRKSKEKYRLHHAGDIYSHDALADKGIQVEYHDGIYKKKIKLTVNPGRVLAGDAGCGSGGGGGVGSDGVWDYDMRDDTRKPWKPNRDNVSKMLRKLDKRIDGYFSSKHGLDDFKLDGIDFAVDIDVGSRENVVGYIRVLHNTGRVKGFSYKRSTDNDLLGLNHGCDKNHHFTLTGNSNDIEFSAFNKEFLSKSKGTKGTLGIEVRLLKHRAVRIYAEDILASKNAYRKSYIKEAFDSETFDKTAATKTAPDKAIPYPTTSQQLEILCQYSKDIFLDTAMRIIPFGDFYKKDEAVRIVIANVHRNKTREKMLRLLDLVPGKKSLYLAIKEISDRNIDKTLKSFEQINLSPVTISKRHEVKHLKNLYFYLLDK